MLYLREKMWVMLIYTNQIDCLIGSNLEVEAYSQRGSD